MASGKAPTSNLSTNGRIAVGDGVANGKYQVGDYISEGTYAVVHEGVEVATGKKVAMKIDKGSGNGFEKEVKALEVLANCPYVGKMLHHEKLQHGRGKLLVLERLGSSISQESRRRRKLRLMRKEGRRRKNEGETETRNDYISTSLVVDWCIQMLNRIRSLHDHGVVHRDIKPSNFLLGPPADNDTKTDAGDFIYIIDFGLSKIFRNKDGTHKAKRIRPGFRGCSKYASIFSHRTDDLGRRDDLWSFWYMILDLLGMELPWTSLCLKKTSVPDDKAVHKERIHSMKEMYYSHPALLLLPMLGIVASDRSSSSSEGEGKGDVASTLNAKRSSRPILLKRSVHLLLDFAVELKTLEYADEPRYDRLEAMLQEIARIERAREMKRKQTRREKRGAINQDVTRKDDHVESARKWRSRAEQALTSLDMDEIDSLIREAKAKFGDRSNEALKMFPDQTLRSLEDLHSTLACDNEEERNVRKWALLANRALSARDAKVIDTLIKEAETKYDGFLAVDLENEEILDEAMETLEKLESSRDELETEGAYLPTIETTLNALGKI